MPQPNPAMAGEHDEQAAKILDVGSLDAPSFKVFFSGKQRTSEGDERGSLAILVALAAFNHDESHRDEADKHLHTREISL